MASCTPDSPQAEEPAVPRMVLDELYPDYGEPGTEVAIRGNNFPIDSKQVKVTFDGIDAQILSASTIEIRVIAPEHKPGDIPVVVSAGSQSVKGYFYFLKPASPGAQPKYPQTEIGKILKGDLCPKVLEVMWDTTYNVTTGVDYYQMTITTDAAEKQNIYLLSTDTSKGLEIKVALPSTTTSATWKKQTLTQMANNISTTSNPVYAMINGDFWDVNSPINPRGPVHCNGKVWSSTWDYNPKQAQQGLSFVGVRNDGSMIIAPRDMYDAVKSDLKECTGAGFILLSDGKFPGSDYYARDPRTAVGYTSDNLVWMLTVDGRHGTKGMTYAEMASIFQGLGCAYAANLDGGGSAQMLIRNPLTGKRQICNWPSDPTEGAGGQERAVINGWTIVKK
jgi:exopolysaccharide biosynthesis protein